MIEREFQLGIKGVTMYDYGDQSEFGGGGVLPNTLFPQVAGVAMTASDQLRLMSITGQETDTHATPDPYFWQGGIFPLPIVKKVVPAIPTEGQRYTETPRV